MKYFLEFDEYINEGRGSWDTLSSSLVSKVFKQWVSDWKAGKKSSSFSDFVQDSVRNVEFDLTATIYFGKVEGTKIKGFEVLKTTAADGRDEIWSEEDKEWEDNDPFINIDFAINDKWLPGEWSEVYMYLADVMRHEMEHITQDGINVGNYRMGKPNEDDSQLRQLIEFGLLPKHQYLLLPKEIDANLQGIRYEAKKRKIPMIDAVNKYLDTQQYLTNETREEVLTTWRRRAKKIGGIPTF